MADCLDIYINNSHPRSRSCSSSNDGFTSLQDSINCWIENGKIDLSSSNDALTLQDNGDGTSSILIDGDVFATVITTATDVTLVDNGDGTSALTVNGTSLGSVTNGATTATNTADIVTNATAIADNATAIAQVSAGTPTNVSQLANDAGYITTETDDQTASEVPFNGIASGLTATDVQGAVNEVSATADANTTAITANDADIVALGASVADNTADITALGAISHTHTNLATLDKFGEDANGAPTYNGALVDTTVAQRDVYDGLDSTDNTISLSANNGTILKDAQDTQQVEIDANEADIATNATAITANDADIATNATNILALSTDSHADDDVETVTGSIVDNTDVRNPVITETVTALGNTGAILEFQKEDGATDSVDLEQIAWLTTGNIGTDSATDFVGTKDAQDVVFKSNNVQFAKGKQNGAVELGANTTASGAFSNSEGNSTTASGSYSHSEGVNTTASGNYSHSEGVNTTASGYASHSEGNETESSGNYSHSEGFKTTASGSYSHSEGVNTTASGNYSHSEGGGTTASGNYSHSEGVNTIASGLYSHSEGVNTIASGNYSHSEGNNTTTSSYAEKSQGTYSTEYTPLSTNTINQLDRMFNVGNGTSVSSRSDMLTGLKNGKIGIGFDNFETTTATEILQVNGSVTANAYNITSDERHKSDFKPTGLSKTINGRKVDVFTYQRTYDGKRELGVKAQDVRNALNGLDEATKDLVVPTSEGIDFNATLDAINTQYEVEGSTLIEAFELALDGIVNSDLESNGFPTIKRKQAVKEFESLLSFEPTENEDGTFTELDDNQKDRLERFKLVDWSGMKTFRTFFVTIPDLHSINTTALTWVS